VLLDLNAMAADGTVSIPSYELSPDGRLLAWAVSVGGSDWNQWRVREIATGTDLPERIDGTKFSGVSWLPDSSGFVYSRYPADASGNFDDSRQVSVYLHRLGQPQSADQLLFQVDDHPTRNPYGHVTDDGEFLVIDLFDGYETSGLYYQAWRGSAPSGAVVRLLNDWDARYEFLGSVGGLFYVLTTRDAPLGRIVAINLEAPAPADWIEIVSEGKEAIEDASLVGGSLFVQYIADAHARVRRVGLDGSGADLELPGRGTVSGFSGHADDTETFFVYSDFTNAARVYRLDLVTGEATEWARPDVGIDPAIYVTDQVFFNSRDGTRVPMYIVARRDAPRDGRRPVVLYGYGGFNVSLLPTYSTARMAWLEAGGVLAVANVRGGGEYGEAWHQAGTRLQKQNVFDDFIAAAEWLIANDYTSADHLAIWGGSNGGLLVAAVAQQRPDLFAAAIPAVGVLDMLRYQTGSANARQWSSDYGLSEVEPEFQALYAYSPYHNLRVDRCYPATLVMADANDDRVSPWHSYKYAAALQRAQGCANPVLIRVETNTGHGAGASTSKLIGEYADQWAFVAQRLGLRPGG
jgi:prolyl oligopeptidase